MTPNDPRSPVTDAVAAANARAAQANGNPPKQTPHEIAFAKQRRHADAVAAGEMSYKDIAEERQKEWAAHVAAMPDADRATLNDWAVRQEAQHKHPLGVVNHHAVPWPVVFMVARYGEEVAHWPQQLSDADRTRIKALDRGMGRPLTGVEPLEVAVEGKATGKRVHLFGHEEYLKSRAEAKAKEAAHTGGSAKGAK